MNKIKRYFDFIVGSYSLFLSFIIIIVLIEMGCPVFFKHKRAGYNGIPFYLLKIRTMTNEKDENGRLLPDFLRITKLGNILRSFSIDELPSIINIIKGEMSFVGPRPLLMRYLDRYTPEQARRHEVHPGLTGWAQVNGRNAISWEEKFKLDVWYVDHQSILLDLKILLLTIAKVLRREGISGGGEATMSEFMGSSEPEDQRG